MWWLDLRWKFLKRTGLCAERKEEKEEKARLPSISCWLARLTQRPASNITRDASVWYSCQKYTCASVVLLK